MASYLITGASRGIGLELVKQLLELPQSQVGKVFAVTRNDRSKDLNDLLAVHGNRGINIVAEITQPESVVKAVKDLESYLDNSGLDVVINNAGVQPFSTGGVETMPAADLVDVFRVNVASVQIVNAAFLPLLRKGREKKVITM